MPFFINYFTGMLTMYLSKLPVCMDYSYEYEALEWLICIPKSYFVVFTLYR